MSTTIYEYTINIDGKTMTPAQLFEFARGLVEKQVSEEDAEWMAADMSARPFIDFTEWIDEDDLLHPDPPWSIDHPSRYKSMSDVSFPAHPEHAKAITVLARHLWQIAEDVSGGDMSDHKTCDQLRICWGDVAGFYTTYSHVWSELDGGRFATLSEIENALLKAFTDLMGNLVANMIANGRKRAGVKW
jgi:hypothetical protein